MRYKIPPEKIKKWVETNFQVQKVRKNGRELVIINPLTGHNKPRLNINIDTGGAWDWGGPEWAGDPNPRTGKRPCHIIRFVQLYRGVSFREALRELVGNDALSYFYQIEKQEERKEEPSTALSCDIPPGYHLLLDPNSKTRAPLWAYLLSRGYTEQEIINNQIHYRSSNILWPYTEFGEIVYMQSRNIYNKSFWFPSTDVKDRDDNIIGHLDVTRDDVLYGFDDVPRSEYIIIAESIFDKNTLGQHCLASGGVILSDGQLKRIKFIGPKQGVVLAPDNDRPAIESILTNAPRIMNMGYKVFFSIPPKIEYTNPKGEITFTKDWNELLTGLKYTKSQAVATLNQRLIPFTEANQLRLRQKLVAQPKNNAKRRSFLT